jgi:hypothetical protein
MNNVMAQQTAVEWLISELKTYVLKKNDIHLIRPCIDKAKQMEKEQIINAWRNGDNDSMYPPQELDRQAEEYYNEMYNKE